jgi:hypothetical protein
MGRVKSGAIEVIGADGKKREVGNMATAAVMRADDGFGDETVGASQGYTASDFKSEEAALKATGKAGTLRNRQSLQSGDFQHTEEAMLNERLESFKYNAPKGEYWTKDQKTLKQLEARDQKFINEHGIPLGYQLSVDGYEIDRPGSYWGIEKGCVNMTEDKVEKILASHIKALPKEYMDLVRTMYHENAGKDKWCEGTKLSNEIRETFRDSTTLQVNVPEEMEPVLAELKLCLDLPKNKTYLTETCCKTGKSYQCVAGLIFLTSKADEEISLFEEGVRGMYPTCRDKDKRIDEAMAHYFGMENDVGVTYFMMAYEILSEIVKNIADNPKEPMYRFLRMSHRKLRTFIFDDEGMMGTKEVLLLTGWELCPQDPDVLMLPMEYTYTQEDVKVLRQRWIWASQGEAHNEYKGRVDSWAAMNNR